MNHTISDERTERLRQWLLTRREAVQRQIDESLARHRETQGQLRDDAAADPDDMSSRDAQGHNLVSIIEARNQMARQLDAALQRLHDGSYGVCEDCLAPITEARLEAVPFARRCVECQRQVETLESIQRLEDRDDR
ncbi:DnaK suppressor protein [Nitrospira sp.]|nr:DnaK suppressor protein [Nitrospira sp.]